MGYYIFLHLTSFSQNSSCKVLHVLCSCLVTQWATLCDPMDCGPPGSSVPGILQARLLEWAAIPFSRAPSRSRGGPTSPSLSGGFFTIEPPGKPVTCQCTAFIFIK